MDWDWEKKLRELSEMATRALSAAEANAAACKQLRIATHLAFPDRPSAPVLSPPTTTTTLPPPTTTTPPLSSGDMGLPILLSLSPPIQSHEGLSLLHITADAATTKTTMPTAPVQAPPAPEEALTLLESTVDRPLPRSAGPTLVPPAKSTVSSLRVHKDGDHAAAAAAVRADVGLSILVGEGLNSAADVLTYIGGLSIFMELDIDSANNSVSGLSTFLEKGFSSVDEMFQEVSLCHQKSISLDSADVSTESLVFELLPSRCYGGFSPGGTSAEYAHVLLGPSMDHLSVTWDPSMMRLILCEACVGQVPYSATRQWDPGIFLGMLHMHLLGTLHLFGCSRVQCIELGSQFTFCIPPCMKLLWDPGQRWSGSGCSNILSSVLLFQSVDHDVSLTLPWGLGDAVCMRVTEKFHIFSRLGTDPTNFILRIIVKCNSLFSEHNPMQNKSYGWVVKFQWAAMSQQLIWNPGGSVLQGSDLFRISVQTWPWWDPGGQHFSLWLVMGTKSPDEDDSGCRYQLL